MPQPRVIKDLLFVDTETTGLDPAKHEILEIALIRTTPDGKDVKDKFSCRVFPEHIETAEPKALEVNKYSAEKWAKELCVEPGEVVDAIQAMGRNTTLVGHNVAFDESFLAPLFNRFNLRVPWTYHRVDTVALAWPLHALGELERLSLANVCQFLGIAAVPAHTAESDAEACRQVYVELMTRWKKIV